MPGEKNEEITPAQRMESFGEGLTMKLGDKDNLEFYGSSITDSYRLKSELVSRSFEEIGMGRYEVKGSSNQQKLMKFV